jgi:hypothetical protein
MARRKPSHNLLSLLIRTEVTIWKHCAGTYADVGTGLTDGEDERDGGEQGLDHGQFSYGFLICQHAQTIPTNQQGKARKITEEAAKN